MYAIFYDLETTDKEPIGQILNYCFIFVDPAGEILSESSGLVRIARTQLPDPGAILANRVNVLEHQRTAHDDERAAMGKIVTFINGCIEHARGKGKDTVALIGYNSSRFDLTYLRTSLIRNGFDPYWMGKIVPRDLLHAVQKGYLNHEPFRQLILKQRAGEEKLSLSLETVGHALGLLSGAQKHESREDVVLSLRVAEWLRRECGIDATELEAYEGARLHSTAGTGAVYLVREPEYVLGLDTHEVRTPVTLLDADHRSALWINLERYSRSQDPTCIMWRSVAKHPFFTNSQAESDAAIQKLARSAVQQFKGKTLKNFFERTTCDIEQDIYRLDRDGRDLLRKLIETADRRLIEGSRDNDLRVLWTRYQLRNPNLDMRDERSREVLRRYAVHRYGGALQLARTTPKGGEGGGFHWTLSQMHTTLRQMRDAAAVAGNQEDAELLAAVSRFYNDSEIMQVAGKELLPHVDRSQSF